ncbi:unnamed protein product [Bemisia tabaci]|nr:unnamed protein product [Bemisia tabaci]
MDIYHGTFIHCENFGEIEVLENTAVVVHENKIVAIDVNIDFEQLLSTYKTSEHKIREIYRLSDQEFLIPGFIDAHIHGPQFENAGLGYDKALLEWLKAYTFPLEKKFEDVNYATPVYEKVVETTLKNGTTTAAYFGTIHSKSCLKLAKIAKMKKQRAFIGKVNMNMNVPDYLTEDTRQSIRDTKQFIKDVISLDDPRIQPIITPRFAVSCDLNMLEQLGAVQKEFNCHVQTHVSENVDEIEFIKQLFPKHANYTDVYKKANLLGEKTILAHGVHLTDEELELIRETNSSVIHCPASNTCLKSGLCNVRRLLNNKIKVGLGTDVAGGYNPTILDAMRRAIDVSNHIFLSNPEYRPLNYKEVFYLATMGGAAALSLGEKIGNFKIGKDFDALLVNMENKLIRDLRPEELFQKFLYLGDDRNIKNVFVAGDKVII